MNRPKDDPGKGSYWTIDEAAAIESGVMPAPGAGAAAHPPVHTAVAAAAAAPAAASAGPGPVKHAKKKVRGVASAVGGKGVGWGGQHA